MRQLFAILARCPCGLSGIHNGWCDFRVNLSAGRQNYLAECQESAAAYWPYLKDTNHQDYEMIAVINNAVPRTLPEYVRADICQNLAVSILLGEIQLDDLQKAIPVLVKSAWKDSPSKYGPLSLDAPLNYGESKSKTLGETIA
jgi:hypothetical protein